MSADTTEVDPFSVLEVSRERGRERWCRLNTKGSGIGDDGRNQATFEVIAHLLKKGETQAFFCSRKFRGPDAT